MYIYGFLLPINVRSFLSYANTMHSVMELAISCNAFVSEYEQ